MKKIIELFDILNENIVKYNPYYSKSDISKAFDFAYNYYNGSKKDILYNLNIAINLTKIEADDISIISSLLFGCYKNNFKNIRDNFGESVELVLMGVHNLSVLENKINPTKDIESFKKEMILAGKDIRVFLVKIAERLHYLENIDNLKEQVKYKIAKEIEIVYLPIVDFLSIGVFLHKMQDLCFKYTNKEKYDELYNIFSKKNDYYKQKIIEVTDIVKTSLDNIGIGEYHIESRIKSIYSIYKKIKLKKVLINDIYDVVAFRIITENEKNAYITLGDIHKNFKVKSERFKDYISSPKKNGYQSIHTTVYDQNGDFMEFQIQTYQMYKLNKTGIAAHFIYKGFGLEYRELPNWMKSVLDIQKKTINSGNFLEILKQELLISEIKCFFEGGNICLPKGSVLIDFAFGIDEDYGKYFLGAYINGVYTDDPYKKLENGDFLKLEKSKQIHINYQVDKFLLVKTKKARDGLKEIFKKYSKSKSIKLGEYLLNSELELYSYKYFSTYSRSFKNKVIKKFGLSDEKQFYLFIALGSIEIEKILNVITSFDKKRVFKKDISLKIFLKFKFCKNINNIVDVFYDLDVELKKIRYNRDKNFVFLNFSLDNINELKELIGELSRVPNVSNIVRIYPMRLKIYYLLCFSSFLFGTFIYLFLQFYDLPQTQKTNYFLIGLNISIFFMIALVFFIKNLVKNILPDVLRYNRFWISQFLLNIYIFLLLFLEFKKLGDGYSFVFFLSISIIMTLFLTYELFNLKLRK